MEDLYKDIPRAAMDAVGALHNPDLDTIFPQEHFERASSQELSDESYNVNQPTLGDDEDGVDGLLTLPRRPLPEELKFNSRTETETFHLRQARVDNEDGRKSRQWCISNILVKRFQGLIGKVMNTVASLHPYISADFDAIQINLIVSVRGCEEHFMMWTRAYGHLRRACIRERRKHLIKRRLRDRRA
jgi:hypothetical protein